MQSHVRRQQQFTTTTHRREDRKNTQCGDLAAGCTSTTEAHIVLDDQDKKIALLTAPFLCPLLHPSVDTTTNPSSIHIFLDRAAHCCETETHADKTHFLFYGMGFKPTEREESRFGVINLFLAHWSLIKLLQQPSPLTCRRCEVDANQKLWDCL